MKTVGVVLLTIGLLVAAVAPVYVNTQFEADRNAYPGRLIAAIESGSRLPKEAEKLPVLPIMLVGGAVAAVGLVVLAITFAAAPGSASHVPKARPEQSDATQDAVDVTES